MKYLVITFDIVCALLFIKFIFLTNDKFGMRLKKCLALLSAVALFNLLFLNAPVTLKSVLNIGDAKIMKVVVTQYPNEPTVIYEELFLTEGFYEFTESTKLLNRYYIPREIVKNNHVTFVIVSTENENIIFSIWEGYLEYNGQYYRIKSDSVLESLSIE